MEDISRRKFLKLVGVGSGAIAVGTMLPSSGLLKSSTPGSFSFRAVGGLPSGGPIPAYASYVLEGHVNVAAKSGMITRTVYAGPPETKGTITWPGLSRTYRVTNVKDMGGYLQIRGEILDRSQLRVGESQVVDVRVDRERGVSHAPFFHSIIPLRHSTA